MNSSSAWMTFISLSLFLHHSLSFATKQPPVSYIALHRQFNKGKPGYSGYNRVARGFATSSLVFRHTQPKYTTFTMSTRSNSINESVGMTDAGKSNRNTNDKDDTVIDWKSRIDISIAKSRKIRGSNYVQISTVDHATMEPRCRTVVFRGFMKNVPLHPTTMYGDCVMKMITDMRSNKVRELESVQNNTNTDKNNVEMVWW